MTMKRTPRPRDPVQLGKRMVDIMTGAVPDAVASSSGSLSATRFSATSSENQLRSAAHVSTSHAGRANFTLRMGSRRFTRLTSAFSKKVENHAQCVAIHLVHYDFVRIHRTLRVTPAMATNVTGQLRELADMVKVLEGRRRQSPTKLPNFARLPPSPTRRSVPKTCPKVTSSA